MLSDEQSAEWMQIRDAWRPDPVLYAQQRLGMNPTRQQAQILEAIAPPGAKVTVRSGHGIGKTGAFAAAIWWHLECFDYCRIPATAPTATQLFNVLWAEMAKWERRSDELSRQNGLPSELYLSNLFYRTSDRIADKGTPGEWYAVARTSRKETADALQGFHASDIDIGVNDEAIQRSASGGALLFVLEEASGIPDAIFEVAEGALSSHNARALIAGNPTKNTGFFARSHKQDRGSYTALHFKSSDSPLVDQNYRPGLVRKWGEGSNVVRVRADGEFPKQEDDVLISLELTEGALTREVPAAIMGERRLGVDVARYGDDRTVFVLRQGPLIEHVEIRSKQDTMTTAGQAIEFFRLWKADAMYVDVVGIGAGVADRCREADLPVVDVNVSEKAPDRPEYMASIPAKLRDYLWLEMRQWLTDDEPCFACDKDHAEDLAGEISVVRYKIDSSGRLVVESKDEMKKRGIRSPDIADALGCTFHPGERGPLIVTQEMLLRSRMPMAPRLRFGPR